MVDPGFVVLAAARRWGVARRVAVLLVAVFMLEIPLLGGTATVARAAIDSEAVLLGQYRLVADGSAGAAHRVLLKSAVTDWLGSENKPSAPGDVAAEIERLSLLTPAERNRTFTARLAARLYEAVFTDEFARTPEQAIFHAEFQHYYGQTQWDIARSTLEDWDAYINSPNPVPVYGAYCCTLGILWDTGKSFSGFHPSNNVIGIGYAGYDALDVFLAPMANSALPDTHAEFVKVGYDPGDGSKIVSALTPIGFTVATYGALFGVYAAYAAVLSAKIVAITGSVASAFALPATVGAFAASAVIVVPILIAGGMKIADLAQRNIFDEKIRYAAAHPDFSPDFFAITGFKTDFQAGLWYRPCKPGFDPVASICYDTQCPSGFHVSALNCTRDANSIIRQTYTRPAQFPDAGIFCPAGYPDFQNDGFCYPSPQAGYTCHNENCIQSCPAGYDTLLTTCFAGAATQPRASYGRGAGSAIPPTAPAVDANKGQLMGILLKWLIADPADYGALGVPPITPVIPPHVPTPNVAPIIVSATPADLTQVGGTIYEGKFFAVDYVVYDPNVGDHQTTYAAWSDGVTDIYPVSDGSIIGANPAHVFAQPGSKEVVLTVVDSAGLNSSLIVPIVVKNVVPMVTATAASAPDGFGAITASVSSGTGFYGTFDVYDFVSVDWGDGEGPGSVPLASLGALSHDYGKGGEFDATVYVQDDDFTVGSASVHLSVVPPAVETTTTTTATQPTTTAVSTTTASQSTTTAVSTTTVSQSTTTTLSGATTTTTTLPCALSLPDDSFAGLDCALDALRATVGGSPRPVCTCKRCSLEPAVDRLAGLVAQAQDVAPKQCRRKVKKTRQLAKALDRRVGMLAKRSCLAPGDQAALEAGLSELLRRLTAAAGGASCGAR